jgi:hypothetical protein
VSISGDPDYRGHLYRFRLVSDRSLGRKLKVESLELVSRPYGPW